MGLLAFGDALGQAVGVLLVEPLGVLRFLVLARYAWLGFVRLRCPGLGLVLLRDACAAGREGHVMIFALLGHLDDILVALKRVDSRRDSLVHPDLLRLGRFAGNVVKARISKHTAGTVAF